MDPHQKCGSFLPTSELVCNVVCSACQSSPSQTFKVFVATASQLRLKNEVELD